MYIFLLLVFVGFHSFILIFPRVVFTKNVNPSQQQLLLTRAVALCFIVFSVTLFCYYG